MNPARELRGPLPRALGAIRARYARRGYPVLVGLALTALFAAHAAGWLEVTLIHRLENMAYDFRLRMSLPGGVDRRVVIVDVDEKSLANEGRWPWSRARVADLVDALFDDYRVQVAGFDMVFAEPEEQVALDVVTAAASAAGRDDVIDFVRAARRPPDARLAESLSTRAVVLGFYFSPPGVATAPVGSLPPPLLPAEIAEMLAVPAPVAGGYGANLKVLQAAAGVGGFFDNPLIDGDGVFRRIPLAQSYRGDLYASLAVAVAEAASGAVIEFDDHFDTVRLAGREIPVDQDLAALIPFRGPQGSFAYVSATDVLRGEADAGLLDGAIVLVGTTAPGLFDLRNTPVQQVYPGVEIHANMVAGILDGRFRSHPAHTVAVDLVQVLVLGIFLSLALPGLGPNRGTLVTLAALAAVVGMNAWFWFVRDAVVPVSGAILLVLLHYVYVTSHGFLTESRNKKALMVQFGRYVPEAIVDRMSRDPVRYTLAGERRELTVMFTDIRGFTQLSENLDPQDTTALMNLYLNRMTRIIHDHHGTIDKYIGDAIMAFWGAPLDDAGHAGRAVAAALAMRAALPEVNRAFAGQGWPPIRVGIGLNTGTMAVGNMGSDFRMAYTVMGDAVNLASRVESLTKTYGVDLLVTGETARRADGYCYRPLDRVLVRGRHEPVDLFEPLMPLDQAGAEQEREGAALAVFFDRYRDGRWSEALEQLETLDRRFGERPWHRVYRERIVALREAAPANWDGVFDLDR